MHICTYIHTYIHICIHTYTYIHIHTYTYTYKHIHTYIHKVREKSHTHRSIHILEDPGVRANTHTHTHIHTHTCTHTHTHTHTVDIFDKFLPDLCDLSPYLEDEFVEYLICTCLIHAHRYIMTGHRHYHWT